MRSAARLHRATQCWNNTATDESSRSTNPGSHWLITFRLALIWVAWLPMASRLPISSLGSFKIDFGFLARRQSEHFVETKRSLSQNGLLT